MRRVMIATSLAFTAMVAPVSAQDFQKVLWKSVGPWTVQVVEGNQNYCEASAYWPGGTSVTLGYAEKRKTPKLVMSNPDWLSGDVTGNSNSRSFDLIVQFGSQMPWRVPSAGTSGQESEIGLQIEGRDLTFFAEILGVQNFGIRIGNQTVTRLEMEKSVAALNELADCQNAISKQSRLIVADAS